jgi:hypothetical protein
MQKLEEKESNTADTLDSQIIKQQGKHNQTS